GCCVGGWGVCFLCGFLGCVLCCFGFLVCGGFVWFWWLGWVGWGCGGCGGFFFGCLGVCCFGLFCGAGVVVCRSRFFWGGFASRFHSVC
ncbi:hypothetical protein, partial [Acinetobacter baumannii]|uniref:hypothetical protein n=1 Tax=Acinetobacter baumannii TaxID=470 RepID=UPI001BC897EC